MALGVGRLLGIATPVNFNHPYLATTFGDFWTRWHMSLGTFVQRNIYNPLMLFSIRRLGNQNKIILFFCNLIALWIPFIFTGLWHHVSWAFLIWGLAVGLIVAAEKALFELRQVKRFLRAEPFALVKLVRNLVGILYTQVMVAVTLTLAIKSFSAYE